jgi:hypothetical protein
VNEKKPTETAKIPDTINTLTTEQINTRIEMIQKEIIQETNNPDRNMELRRELYILKKQ